MNFTYSGYDRAGKPVSGGTSAASSAAARAELSKRGLFITALREGGQGAGAPTTKPGRAAPKPTSSGKSPGARPARATARAAGRAAEGVAAGDATPTRSASSLLRRGRLKNISDFASQLSVLVATGTPLVQALGALHRQAKDEHWRGHIQAVRAAVEEGSTLTEAVSQRPDAFDAVSRSLIAAGEASGKLEQMLRRLAVLTREQQKLSEAVSGAMAYPALLMLIAVNVMITMLLVVVPRFGGMFKSLDAPLPASTKVLLTMSELLREYWWACLLVIAAASVGGVLWAATREGRRAIDWAVLRLPLVGGLVQRLAVARLSRLLGVLVESQVPLIESLRLTRDAMTNWQYKELVERAEEAVTNGDALATAFTASPLVPPSMSEAVVNGEATGRLGDVLSSVADYMDEQNSTIVKSLTTLIEPVILLVMGLVVGGMAISMFLPLFDIAGAARGGA